MYKEWYIIRFTDLKNRDTYLERDTNKFTPNLETAHQFEYHDDAFDHINGFSEHEFVKYEIVTFDHTNKDYIARKVAQLANLNWVVSPIGSHVTNNVHYTATHDGNQITIINDCFYFNSVEIDDMVCVVRAMRKELANLNNTGSFCNFLDNL